MSFSSIVKSIIGPKQKTGSIGINGIKVEYSKSELGLCKNDGCKNKRRTGSAYCEKCSVKHKIDMKKLIIASLMLLFIGSPALASTESDINAERVKAKLPKLTIYSGLQQSATDKVLDMIAHNYFAHISPAGKSFSWFILNKKIKYVVAGEILAKNYSGAELIKAWMDSPTHKAIILDKDFNKVGCYQKNGLTACHFIRN